MVVLDAKKVASVFGLGEAYDVLTPISQTDSPTSWKLHCDTGQYFVKRVRADEPDWWRGYAERAMDFERKALDAGIEMPRPIEPLQKDFGFIAHGDEDGPIRAYEWVDMRPLSRDDNVAMWLGRTLATLHRIEPSSATGGDDDPFAQWDTKDYGIRAIDEWRSWFEEARASGSELGPLGLDHLDAIEAANRFVEESIAHVDDHVITHKDVEPWNLVMTPDGPMLIDWDWVGRDSAWLVAAWSAVAYGAHEDEREQPDPERTRAVLHAYIDAGGKASCAAPWSMGRRIGLRLTRVAYHTWIALGHRPAHKTAREEALWRAKDGLSGLPGLLDDCQRWADLVDHLIQPR